MADTEFDEKKEIASVALEQLLDTPIMQAVESKNPHCRHCGEEITGEDLVFE